MEIGTFSLVLFDDGDVLTYTISLQNPGATLASAWVTDTLPAEVTYMGNLSASKRTLHSYVALYMFRGILGNSADMQSALRAAFWVGAPRSKGL